MSARKQTLFHNVLVQRVLTFSLSRESGLFPLVIAVYGKKLCFKDNPCLNLLSCFAACVWLMIVKILCKLMPTLTPITPQSGSPTRLLK